MSKSEQRKKGGSNKTKLYLILGAVVVIGAVAYSVGSNAFGAAVTEPIEVEGLDDQNRLVELAQGITKGDPDAAITIVEFGDFQCPGCAGFALSVKPQVDLVLVESGRAKFLFYDFPLTQIHPNAFLAARAGRCAVDQDSFWQYHDVLFRNQSSWAAAQNPIGRFLDYSETAGLDRDTFEACLKSDRHADVVSANMRLGYELGVSGTPTIMVHGYGEMRRLNSSDFQSIATVVEELSALAESPGN